MVVSKLEEINSLKFEKMILEYWQTTKNTGAGYKRLYRQFTDVWKWFYHNQGINKNQFNELFLRLIRDTKSLVRLHGSPTGSYNEKTRFQVPDDKELYQLYARKVFGIWSLDESYSRLDNWSGKPKDD